MAARRKPASQLKRKRDTRPSAAKRGYGWKWRQKRAKKVKGGSAKCTSCGRTAGKSAHVHHSGKGLRVKCQSCHNRISAKNKAKRRKRAKR